MFDGFLNGDSNTFLLIGALIVGFIVIIYGGDKFVDSAVWLAVKTKMPKMLIGATVVSICTTLPEMFASFTGAVGGSSAIAIGNAVGSIMCNTAVVLAISLIAAPAFVSRKQFVGKYAILMVALVCACIFTWSSVITLWQCIILFVIGIGYFVYNIVTTVRDSKLGDGSSNFDEDEEANYLSKNSVAMILFFVLGAVLIAVGANLLVSSVEGLCIQMNVDEAIIALTVISVGTSLPELITAITSLRKNNTEISIGNIIGANVLNITLIVGGSGFFTNGLTINSCDYLTIIVTMFAIMAVLIIVGLPILLKKKTYRWQGIATVAIYVGYVGFLISQL